MISKILFRYIPVYCYQSTGIYPKKKKHFPTFYFLLSLFCPESKIYFVCGISIYL